MSGCIKSTLLPNGCKSASHRGSTLHLVTPNQKLFFNPVDFLPALQNLGWRVCQVWHAFGTQCAAPFPQQQGRLRHNMAHLQTKDLSYITSLLILTWKMAFHIITLSNTQKASYFKWSYSRCFRTEKNRHPIVRYCDMQNHAKRLIIEADVCSMIAANLIRMH